MIIGEKWRREKAAITNVFKAHRIGAKAVRSIETPTFVQFGIRKRAEEKIARIEGLEDELSLALSELYGKPVPVRISYPPIVIEMPHPKPRLLLWPQPLPNSGHSATAGRAYVGGVASDEIVSFGDTPHVLIAGVTGSGKSVLAQGLALSMAMQTPPSVLRYQIIDLKRDDLVPLARLNHTLKFAGDPDSAIAVVEDVAAEVARRRDSSGPPPYRLALWIDELAQLPKVATESLNEILALGRSMQVNVIGATQYPTAQTLGNGASKVNYTVRLVGQMMDAQAASTATGRGQTGAENLPGNGAFLRIDGGYVRRFQAYYLSAEHVSQSVKAINDRWTNSAPAQAAQDAHSEELAKVFIEYYDGGEGLQRGGLMAAKRAIFGPVEASNDGRKAQEQNTRVRAELRRWIDTSPLVS